jgi:hypothetical protein
MIGFWSWNGAGVWGQLPPQRPSHSLLTSRIQLVHITMIPYISVTSSWYIYQSHYHNTVFISTYSILYAHWEFSCFAAGVWGSLTPTKSSIYLKLNLASYSTEGGLGHPLYGGSCRLSMHTLASIHIVNTSFITHTRSPILSHFISSFIPHASPTLSPLVISYIFHNLFASIITYDISWGGPQGRHCLRLLPHPHGIIKLAL